MSFVIFAVGQCCAGNTDWLSPNIEAFASIGTPKYLKVAVSTLFCFFENQSRILIKHMEDYSK